MSNPFEKWREHVGRVIDVEPVEGGPGGPRGPRVSIPAPGLGSLLRLLAAVAVAVGLWTMWFQVGANEVGIVLRFGAYTGTPAPPGLHMRLPWGIDRVYKVPVQTQLKEEFGFRTAVAGVRTSYDPKEFDEESLMLTGDLNAADVEWIVQYRIRDPYRYLFRVRHVEDTLRDLTEAVMRIVVGDRTVNEVLTVGRQEVATEVTTELQALCDQYEMGIAVDQVVLQDVTPPDPVKPSFNEVNQAQQEREKLINQARSEYNQVVPRAKGEAEQTIAQAEGYAVDRVNRARGDAARFSALLAEYRKAPAVTRRRIYLETLGEVLPRVERKIVLDEDAKGILPLLNLPGEKTP